MEKKYFSLGSSQPGPFMKIIRIVFGLISIAVTIAWLILGPESMRSSGTFWITIGFLMLFGIAQIWTGFGKAVRFIEITQDSILLKKDSIFPTVVMNPGDISKVDIHPMKVVFRLKTNKNILLRFGSVYQETNETIKDELILFSDNNNIPFEIVEEKL